MPPPVQDPLLLERLNPHPRDARIVFDEPSHKYTLDGSLVFTKSVSGLVHACFPEFDAKKIVNQYFGSWAANKDSKYFSLIRYLRHVLSLDDETVKHEIAASWNAAGKAASGAGTKTHLVRPRVFYPRVPALTHPQDIELLINEDARSDAGNEDLVKYHAWRATVPDWEPYRTEWSVFHEEACISGQIDSLWRDKDGTYHMLDWKRCKLIEPESREKGFKPFDKLPNTNLGHYTVQQNAYAYILQSKYGIECKTLSLMQLHPDIPTFRVWPLELLPEETALAFKRRADAVRAGEIVGMVSASAGKPPLTEEQAAAREAEKASDARIRAALMARAKVLEAKWEEGGAKRARSDAV